MKNKKYWCWITTIGTALLAGAVVIGLIGVSEPLPDEHGLDGVFLLSGTELDVVLPVNAVRQLPVAPNPEFAVDQDHGIWMISNGELLRAREEGNESIHWERLDPDWKGFHAFALTLDGALLAARGYFLTQYSDYTAGEKALAKALALDGLLLPHNQMRLASSNLPGTIYAFGSGDGIDAQRVYAFYDAGETAILCEVPNRVQAISDGRTGLYVATAHEIYRFDINGEHRALLMSLPADAPPIRSLAVTEDERTLVWATDNEISVMEGRASLPLVVGFGGVVRIKGQALYAYSPARQSLIRIQLPDPQ